jgi:parallel beta-helix repeat protein
MDVRLCARVCKDKRNSLAFEQLEDRLLLSNLYTDSSNGNCLDTGPGSITQPFCTIGAAAKKAVAGDTVSVSSGTYSEMVVVKNSGTPGAPIAFTAAPDASVIVRGQSNGFKISRLSWITIHGFTINETTSKGIYVANSSHIVIENNEVSYAGRPVSGQTAQGIYLTATRNSRVSGNVTRNNSDAGIYLTSGSTGVDIVGNTSHSNARGYTRAAPGIDLRDSPGNTISGNVTHDNEDSGIQIYSGSHNNLIVNNLSYNNGDHGIDVLGATGQRIISNSVYHSATAGINVEGGSNGAMLANNISVDNGINSPRTKGNIRVDSNSTEGTTLDYDIVFLHVPQVMLVWGKKSYLTLAAFVAATAMESHGIQADPQWAGPDTGDMHLLPGSPAIDSANSDASGQSATDAAGQPRVDDPMIANAGAGLRSYDDRGAFEFFALTNLPPVSGASVNWTQNRKGDLQSIAPLRAGIAINDSQQAPRSTPYQTFIRVPSISRDDGRQLLDLLNRPPHDLSYRQIDEAIATWRPAIEVTVDHYGNFNLGAVQKAVAVR